MAIECKSQFTDGSAYEKFSYALEDCSTSPIPMIIVFAGDYIRDDMKAKLITSGMGIEVEYVEYVETDSIVSVVKRKLNDPNSILRQRCYVELDLNWVPFATGDRMREQLSALGYKQGR